MSHSSRNLILLTGLVVGIVVAGGLAYYCLREPPYKGDLRRALEHFNRGDHSAALPLFEEVAEYPDPVPERATANFYIGWIHLARRNVPEAFCRLKKAWNESSDEVELLQCGRMLAALAYQEGEFEILRKVLTSLNRNEEYIDFAAGDREILFHSDERFAPEFFLKHEEFGLDKRGLLSALFVREDVTFWARQFLYREVGLRIFGEEGEFDEKLRSFFDWINLNVVPLPEGEKKGFASSPFHCLYSGDGNLTERTWTLCAFAQMLALKPLVMLVGPKQSPVVVMWYRKKGSWLCDMKTGAPVLIDGGRKMATLDCLLAENPPKLDAGTGGDFYDYTAEDFKRAACHIVVHPQRVLVRSRLVQISMLQYFSTKSVPPVYVDVVAKMEEVAHRFLVPTERKFEYPWRTKDGAEVRLWQVPFDFRRRVRLQEKIERFKAGSNELLEIKKENPALFELAERGIDYSRKSRKRLEMLRPARTFMLNGVYDDALKQLGGLLDEDGGSSDEADEELLSGVRDDARYFVGLCLYEMGDYEAAVEKLEACISGDPPGRWKDAANMALGMCLVKLDRPDEARAAFRRVGGGLKRLAAYHSARIGKR